MAKKRHPFRIWRKARAKTLADIAADVGCVPSYISDIERGEKQPSLTVASKLSRMSGIPIDKFALEAA